MFHLEFFSLFICFSEKKKRIPGLRYQIDLLTLYSIACLSAPAVICSDLLQCELCMLYQFLN